MVSILKRILLVLIIIIVLSGQIAFAVNKERFPSDKFEDISITELEPVEFYSLSEYNKSDLELQKKASGIWSTLNQINLNQYSITSIASSELGKQYARSNLYDGKAETAWVEGAKGNGIGEWVKIKIDAYRGASEYTTTPFSIEEIGIIPGYAKSEKTWLENNRVKTLLLIVHSPPPLYSKKLEWVAFRLLLQDNNKLQYFKLPDNKIASNDSPMTKIAWIKIEEIYEGTKYDDTCISELVLYGGCSN